MAIEDLDSLINESDPILAAVLRSIRAKIDGNNYGAGENGALDKLRSGNFVAAMVKMKKAIEALGAPDLLSIEILVRLRFLLSLTAESIATNAYLEAVETAYPPSSQQARKLRQILDAIDAGHQSLIGSDFAGGLDEFKRSVQRANGLI